MLLFWTVFVSGVLLMAAGLLIRPKRLGLGWSLDVGYSDGATRLERILFFAGVALALLALLALR